MTLGVVAELPNIAARMVDEDGYLKPEWREWALSVQQRLFYLGNDVVGDIETDLTSIPASAVTSGTFDNDRIAKSNVTQHINDAGTGTNDFWSADKIASEVGAGGIQESDDPTWTGDHTFQEYVLLEKGIEYDATALPMQFMRSSTGTNRFTITSTNSMVLKDGLAKEHIRLTGGGSGTGYLEMRTLPTTRQAAYRLWNQGGTIKINDGTLFSLTSLTDNTGGSAPNQTLEACGDTTSSDQSGVINDNFREIREILEEIKTQIDG